MSTETPERAQIHALADAFSAARSVLFITGAGVSADSGLPTYRGVGGLYNSGLTSEGIPIEAALSGDMLRARPEICWKYMLQIERACRGAAPNAAHTIIASLQQRVERGWVLTQNVDGLHDRAGSSNLIEIHGNLRHLHCLKCDWTAEVDDFVALEPQLGTPEDPIAPQCPACNAGIRPRVVLFGEMLPPDALTPLEAQLRAGFDLVVSVGTTSAFPYIAAPVVLAKRAGKVTVEINPGTTDISDIVDLRIQAGAADTFEALAAMLDGEDDA
ncbi:MAG: NAD-dependent deacylase [Myxococcota bacterium]